ncbi:MAG: ssl1498 family light-harvesting-like protein [Acaryochloridaceae cyanobacterium SU_2_1]|nr:ssl1498 family light-harvesting-like protein [Acaryochloridaceae cyanobacterium SU_2_1]
MSYITEEGGLLNNFAAEPKAYAAEPLTAKQKKTNIVLIAVAVIAVGGLCAFAATLS